MCTFGALGLSCEGPAAPKPPGFHTTTREPKRAHSESKGLSHPIGVLCGNLTRMNQEAREEVGNMRLLRGL